MHHSFLGLVFNITVLFLEYKRVALAQSFSLGYKPIRPSYFNPDHPGHHPGQTIPPGWLWPNRRPDLPQQGVDQIMDNTNTLMVNHWFRPIIITNTMSTGSNGVTATSSTTTQASFTTISAEAPTTVAGSPHVQFLPEGDLYTSAPVRSSSIKTPSIKTASITEPAYIELGEPNVTVIVADLLPLPLDVAKNASVDNLNLLLPVLPLNAPKINDIS